jgi:hypothetical protein
MQRFTRVNGHVLSSVMEFVEDCRKDPLPKGWSVRSKCRPDEEACVNEVIEEFEKLNKRVTNKATRMDSTFSTRSNGNRMKESMIRALNEEENKSTDQVYEREVNDLREVLRDLVVAPIDKLVGDAAIL